MGSSDVFIISFLAAREYDVRPAAALENRGLLGSWLGAVVVFQRGFTDKSRTKTPRSTQHPCAPCLTSGVKGKGPPGFYS